MSRLLIKGGTVVTATEIMEAEVLVEEVAEQFPDVLTILPVDEYVTPDNVSQLIHENDFGP